MADDEYNRKLQSLQQYIPFLNNMITQLKDPRKKTREQQLIKMVSLHSMISDKKKKLKLETLIKCEDVILKLYGKVKNGPGFQNELKPTNPAPITPSSPSPPPDIPLTTPVVIPTEKVERDSQLTSFETYSKPKIDIYSSAVVNLKPQTSEKKVEDNNKKHHEILDVIGKKVPDMSKPPISLEDLQSLQDDSTTNSVELLSLNELNDLRDKIQKQLSNSKNSDDKTVNTTVRNTTILTKKAVEKTHKTKTPSPSKAPPPSTSTNKSVKHLKEETSIFGAAISSIDSKILETSKERRISSDKNESNRRRSSISESYKKTDSKSSTDEKKSTTKKSDEVDKKSYEFSRKSDVQKKKENDKKSDIERRKSHETSNKRSDVEKKKENDKKFDVDRKKSNENDKRYDAEKKKENDKKSDLEKKRSNESDSKKLDIEKRKTNENDNKSDADKKKSIESEKRSELDQKKTNEIDKKSDIEKKSNEIEKKDTSIEETSNKPTYTRLADKYNRKPRKPSIETSTPIPATIQPQPVPPPPVIPLTHIRPLMSCEPRPQMVSPIAVFNPQPSPTFSTNSIDSDYSQSGSCRKIPPLIPPLMASNNNQFRPIQPFPNHPQQNNQFNFQSSNIWSQPPLQQPQQNNYHDAFASIFNKLPLAAPHQNDRRIPGVPQIRPLLPTPPPPQVDFTRDVDWRRESSWGTPQIPQQPPRDPRLTRDVPPTTNQNFDNRRSNSGGNFDKRGKMMRDPRLNRPQTPHPQPVPPPAPSPQQPQTSNNESKHFYSPLDSLYDGGIEKTGKGYGVQKFKIPKKNKKIEETTTTTTTTTTTSQIEECWDEEPIENVNNTNKKIDENIASANVSSSTEQSNTINNQNSDEQKNCEEIAEISSTDDIVPSVVESIKKDETPIDKDKTEIINEFLQKLLKDSRTQSAATHFLENVSHSLDDEKLKQIVDSVQQSDAETLRKQKLEQLAAQKRRRLKLRKMKLLEKRKRLALLLKKKRKKLVALEESDEEEEEEEEEEEVKPKKGGKKKKTSKNSKKSPSTSPGAKKKDEKDVKPVVKKRKKPKTRHRTELDLLHEDIQEMFIRDGVLTATGTRMCRLLKNDNDQSTTSTETSPVKRQRRTRATTTKTTITDSKTKSITDDDDNNKEKFKMSNVRVVITKIPIEAPLKTPPKEPIESTIDGKRYSLRRSKSKSYKDIENSDEEIEKKTTPVETKKEEEEESEDIAEEEEENNDDSGKKMKKQVKNKRTKSWTSNSLPKRKKLKEENEDSDDNQSEKRTSDIDLIEPDLNYYPRKEDKCRMQCKLCNFEGKHITLHYKSTHPDSEILSSRLSQKQAELALKQSIDLKLDEITKPIQVKSSTKHHYVCRFCDTVLYQAPCSFYDHISTHTGEYRHLCSYCKHTACNVKTMMLHYKKIHPGKNTSYIRHPIRNEIFGYLCTDCNYVQMKKESVESHVNIYHLGEGNKIVRIYLTSIEPKNSLNYHMVKKESSTVTESSDENDKEETDEIIHEEIDIPPDSDSDKLLPIPPIEIKKEIDMTVFTCQTNIEEEINKIEEERLKTMCELNESVKTTRQSLSFVDSFLNERLIEQKNENNEDDDDKNDEEMLKIDKVIMKPCKKQPTITTIPKLVEKENQFTLGIVEKLKGILGTNLQPTLITFGLFAVNVGTFEFCCQLPNCEHVSNNTNDFLKHWQSSQHDNYNKTNTKVKCEFCEKTIEKTTEDCNLLTLFYQHFEEEHLPTIQMSKTELEDDDNNKPCCSKSELKLQIDKNKEEQIECDTPTPPPLTPFRKPNNRPSIKFGLFSILIETGEYACGLPACCHIAKDRDLFLNHWQSIFHKRYNQTTKTVKCEKCQINITDDSNILMKFYEHVHNEHLSSTINTSIEPMDTNTPIQIEENEEKDMDNPFSFKIVDVVSLATTDQTTTTTETKEPIEKTSIEKKIDLKEIPLRPSEMNLSWKCPMVYTKFMKQPKELYKCPQYYCTFATENGQFFRSHIETHIKISDDFVLCLYCNKKTAMSQCAIHIEVKHSNNLFSCSKCLYRAAIKEYVVVHMKEHHHNKPDMIMSIPPVNCKMLMTNVEDEKHLTVAQACPPYCCGFEGCNEEFLFETEFLTHITLNHNSKRFKCGFKGDIKCNFECSKSQDMLIHWNGHDCYIYHCLYCKSGKRNVYEMLEHYSECHQHLTPMVVCRKTGPMIGDLNYTQMAFASVTYVSEKTMKESLNSLEPGGIRMVPLKVVNNKLTNLHPQNVIAILPNVTENRQNSIKVVVRQTPQIVEQLQPLEKQNKNEQNIIDNNPQHPIVFVSNLNQDNNDNNDDKITNNTSNDDIDPLSINSSSSNLLLPTEQIQIDDGDSSDASMKNLGLNGQQLYKCAFCKTNFDNSRLFKLHYAKTKKECQDQENVSKPFRCAHCDRSFRNFHGLFEHTQYHGQLRFFCSLCERKFPSLVALKLHMRNKHNVVGTITTPLIPNKTDLEFDEFVLRPKPTSDNLIESSNTTTTKTTIKQEIFNKIIYQPNEIDQIPYRCIFNYELMCGLCSFKSKVRMNLVRHLELHIKDKNLIVPEKAPVNPVPCLERNEKMFDKMTNLAISSFTGSRMGGTKIKTETPSKEETDIPEYVSSLRRYSCPSQGCNYLCPEERNLRQHLFTLHATENPFICQHCKHELKTDIDGFLKHLKLHDLHLYKCNHCNFIHHLRHKVEKHGNDKHNDKIDSVYVVRALESEIIDGNEVIVEQRSINDDQQQQQSPKNTIAKIWHCGICKYRSNTQNEVIAHVQNKHDISTQFKCTLCAYKSDEKSTFSEHFQTNHPNNDINIIDVYYKNDKQLTQCGKSPSPIKTLDTTPLWQRDRPRVRHIRGILIEETTPVKMKKNNAGKAIPVANFEPIAGPSTVSSNLDLSIEAVARGSDNNNVNDEDMDIIEDDLLLDDDDVMLEEDDELLVNELLDADFLTKQSQDLLMNIEGDLFNDNDDLLNDHQDFLISKDKLLNQYGLLCSPLGKCFRCPICLKYKTKKITYFVYHLLTELNVHRLECKTCRFKCLTNETIVKHCSDEHNYQLRENIIDVPIKKTIEYWLQIMLEFQSKQIIDGTTPDEDDPTGKNKCDYCKKMYKSVVLLKEHQLVHWANPTYVCGHCPSKFEKIDELFQHCHKTHSNQECLIDTKASTPYISSVLTSLCDPPLTGGGGVTGNGLTGEERVYSCSQCGEERPTLNGLRRHFSNKHTNATFTYRIITKSRIYACAYCHWRDGETELRNHHAEQHTKLTFSMYQFICLECTSSTFQTVRELRWHFQHQHNGKRLTYSCIELKPTHKRDEEFCCTRCPYRGCSIATMRSHVRKHLRPFDCKLCGQTFIQPIDARSHHVKEHGQAKEFIEENKQRIKEYEENIVEIVKNQQKIGKGEGVKQQPAVKRMMARKSTGAPFVRDVQSNSSGGGNNEEMKILNSTIKVNKKKTK